ncbi:MAG: hypothetical protein CM15mP25_3210 [Gammaproteobacteria bacterium]|nr:MAG: hypothetical protein CM15mP25_3210 [Gammaproteobacteria bacterium]
MSRDDLNDIPSFTANREEAVSSAPRGAIPPRAPRGGAAMGLTARLVLTIALAVAGIACGWAWQLQTLLDASETQQKATQARVSDLEALLSDTDETVNKSAAAMGAQLRLLDTEVRKLWDARKISNAKITKLKKTVVTQEKQITGLTTKPRPGRAIDDDAVGTGSSDTGGRRFGATRSGARARKPTWSVWQTDSINRTSRRRAAQTS